VVRVATKFLVLTIAKDGILVRVAEPDGTPIMTDASPVEQKDGAITWERTAVPEARYFGLGAREDGAIELRGTRTAALKPFLISTAGYGEFHAAPGSYTFDLAQAKADRYRIEARGANRVDYYFFFGPTPKDILEQYLLVDGPMKPIEAGTFRMLKKAEIPKGAVISKSATMLGTIHTWINGGLSGVLLPAMGLDAYQGPSDITRRRAGASAEMLGGSKREKLQAYFDVYAEEARDRGLPLIRALPMQFLKDAEAAKVNDEFMLGDELLVAPLLGEEHSRSVYFPMGIWTRLSNNQTFPGRQRITIEAANDELPLFCRNGTILPLGSNPTVLHYFPKLGAEFFFFERDLEEYSQVHAAPAGDYLRLEIESRKERTYEWIVHHLDKPRKIDGMRETAGPESSRGEGWFYDSGQRNLHVRIVAHANEDRITNISF
jgi:hypothetical protein